MAEPPFVRSARAGLGVLAPRGRHRGPRSGPRLKKPGPPPSCDCGGLLPHLEAAPDRAPSDARDPLGRLAPPPPRLYRPTWQTQPINDGFSRRARARKSTLFDRAWG